MGCSQNGDIYWIIIIINNNNCCYLFGTYKLNARPYEETVGQNKNEHTADICCILLTLHFPEKIN